MSQDFISFARAHGLDINPTKLYPSENIRRCGTVDKPKSTNGAYYWSGERGFVWNWAEEAKAQWFEDPHARRWTEEEKKSWLAKRHASRVTQEQTYAKAAAEANTLLRSAKVTTHPYLHIKGFPDLPGLVLPELAVWDSELASYRTVNEVLLIPMRSLSGALVGVQQIWWEEEQRKYVKKMIAGMRAKGAVLQLGDHHAPEAVLVEGYVTGQSVLAALRSTGIRASVLVCFSAHNLEHVAPLIHAKACVFADNDPKSHQGEKSAKATGLPYCMSEVDGFDANDIHLKQGLMKVTQLIMQARRAGN